MAAKTATPRPKADASKRATKAAKPRTRKTTPQPSASAVRRARLLTTSVIIGTGLVAAAATAVGAAELFANSDVPHVAGAVEVSAAELRSEAASAGHRVYWLGPRPGTKLELTRSHGSVYIRYLPHGVATGTTRSGYTTVASYPVRNAYGIVRTAAAASGIVARGPGPMLAVRGRSPTSVYVAYPRSRVLIEIYDPAPARARALARSGRLVPIG